MVNCFLSHEIINSISYSRDCNFDQATGFISIPSGIKSFHKKAGIEAFGIDNRGRFVVI